MEEELTKETYYSKNKEKIQAYAKAYQSTDARKQMLKKYRQTEAYKTYQKKYQHKYYKQRKLAKINLKTNYI